GTRPPAPARESMAAGDAPGVLTVRFSLGRAASPTDAMAWRSRTWKLVSVWRCWPPMVAVTCVCQIPALSNAAWVTYTPLGPEGDTTSAAVLSGAAVVPGPGRNVPVDGALSWHGPAGVAALRKENRRPAAP